jgi:hypothetical protein
VSDAIDRLDPLGDGDTIFAEAPVAFARAAVARQPED